MLIDSRFYIVMTKGTKEYDGKGQTWFTGSNWTVASNGIREAYKEGKVITGICYSTWLEQYLVVMTKMPQEQTYRWFKRFETTAAMRDWEDEKFKQGYHPTIIFKNPTDNKTLSVMTKDENRSGYVRRTNYELR